MRRSVACVQAVDVKNNSCKLLFYKVYRVIFFI